MKAEPKTLEVSYYYQKHRKVLCCPYCGYKVEFVVFYSYDSSLKFWRCPECDLYINDRPDYDEHSLGEARKYHRRQLKSAVERLERELAEKKRQYSLYGKYMTPKQKVKLLAEELED
jgi:uncharacterized C2H2 Zn-finger protein